MRLRDLQKKKVGDQVWWNDPDKGISSGVYSITEILTDSGTITNQLTMVVLKNWHGSEAEVFAHELEEARPEQKVK